MTVVLGLGSNIGDRLAHLRKTLHALKQLPGLIVEKVSPVYISDALLPDNAPTQWDTPYLNVAIRCETSLQPLDLLDKLQAIEWSVGKKPEKRHWGPRIIDIDVLTWDDKVIQSERLTVPRDHLLTRPFQLLPLADVIPDWIYPLAGPHHGKVATELADQWPSRLTGEAPFRTRQIYQRIDTPQLVGIVNVTPDSNSDGGLFLSPDHALAQIKYLVDSGAEVIDIGAESTSPRAIAIDADAEWQRLLPVLSAYNAIKNEFLLPVKLSIDTRHADVAAKALKFGADWINDVSGCDDTSMRSIIAEARCECVVMHHLRLPEDRHHHLPRNVHPASLVYEWGQRRLDELEKAGIARDRIIFDPGIGFGKLPDQSLLTLQQANLFTQLGTRLLLGYSRKSIFTLFTSKPPAERDVETIAVTCHLAKAPIDYLRIHQIEMASRALRVTMAL